MISVIVPVRFRPDLVKVCLDSIRRYSKHQIHLIVVNDGGGRELRSVLRPATEVFTHEEPQGYVASINSGYTLVHPNSRYVIFLNSDTVVVPGWDEALVGALKDTTVGLAAPLLQEDGPQSIERDGPPIEDLHMVKGVCMAFRAKTLRKLCEGGVPLDPRFGMGGGDDNDLCHRVKRQGLRVVLTRKSFVYHYGSASFREVMTKEESRSYAPKQFYRFKEKWKLKERPRILFVVPTLDGHMFYELTALLIYLSHQHDYHIAFAPIPFKAPLDSARNEAVRLFLENYYDYLFFCDADIVPPPNVFEKLLGADKDIVSALCFSLRSDAEGVIFPFPSVYRLDPDGYRPDYGKGLKEVDAIGGGAFLVKRKVFEQLPEPFAFTYRRGVCEFSEDFVFSRKAKEAGFSLWCDFTCRCKHIRAIDLGGVNDLLVKQNGRKSS